MHFSSLLGPEAVYVSILRDPSELFHRMYLYYGLDTKWFPGMTFDKYIDFQI